ncbi:MAG TPA: septum site-determining protein MinC, partial [Gammaproteobacteria bacterium]|nr:septum site-determining protein MinC [Gammaproteobacteria bacterium]
IDLKEIKNTDQDFDFRGLMKLLSQQRLKPVGIKNGSSQQNVLAVSAGLALLQNGIRQASEDKKPSTRERTVETGNQPKSAPELVQDVRQNLTKVIKQPVRSGQQIYAKGGDLIILAPVNHGAEIIADGNIHVYSTMRGRALAGVRGDVNASIFCQSMLAELVAIAGNFRVFEDDMPAEIKSKAVRIHLDGEQLVISQL